MQTPVNQIFKVITLMIFMGSATLVSGQITYNTGDDCSDVTTPICGSGTMTYTTGSGTDQDFVYGSGSNPSTNPAGFNSGCLLAGELNPMFFLINITSSGTLEWTFGNVSGSAACQDWIMWPYTASTCSGIAAGTLPPVMCNWNGGCSGLTGMASPLPAGANAADFMNELNVTAGQQFLLCISNYSSQSGTGALNFIGTAGVGCGGQVTICPGESILLDATMPTATGYSWSPAAGLSSTTTATTTATPATPTLYTCTVSFPLGLTSDTLINVSFYTPPTTGFTTTPETCQGDLDGTITMTPTGTAPFTYTLNGVATAGPTFTGIGGGNYTVVITDANGCESTVVIPFASGPVCCTMVLNTTSTPTLCATSCDGTANVNIVGNVNPPVINWLNAAGNPIGQNTATATGLCAGTYTAEVTDPGECTLTMNVTVTSGAPITINSIIPTNASCNGACNGQLNVNAPTAVQYSIDGGVSFQASNIFTGLCAMTYQVVAENANGCQAQAPATITEPTVLTVQVAPGGAINPTCFGVSNGAINMDVTGGTTPYNYSWNTTPVQNVQDAINLPDGNWCLTVTDAQGCAGNQCVTVTQPTDLTIAFLVVDPSCYNYCDGNASVVPSGGITPYSYNWGTIPGTTPASTQANGLCNGVYNLIVTDANGCTEDTLNFAVVHPAQVQVGLVTPTDETCFQTCDGQITIASPDGAMYSIDGGTSYQASPLFAALCSGTYNIVVEDANGCSNTATTSLTPQPEIIAEFSATPQPTNIYTTDIFFNNTSVFANTYQWTFDSLGTSTDTEPMFFFPDTGPGTYQVCLTATDLVGCFDTVCHDVVINDILYYYVPNAFTPDGNGTNDIFLPVLNNVSEDNYNFYIFNRWGETVFHTTDINQGWDGNSKLIKAKSDVYVWKITGKNNENAEKFQVYGHVSLLR